MRLRFGGEKISFESVEFNRRVIPLSRSDHVPHPVKKFAKLKIDIAARAIPRQDRVAIVNRGLEIAGILGCKCGGQQLVGLGARRLT